MESQLGIRDIQRLISEADPEFLSPLDVMDSPLGAVIPFSKRHRRIAGMGCLLFISTGIAVLSAIGFIVTAIVGSEAVIQGLPPWFAVTFFVTGLFSLIGWIIFGSAEQEFQRNFEAGWLALEETESKRVLVNFVRAVYREPEGEDDFADDDLGDDDDDLDDGTPDGYVIEKRTIADIDVLSSDGEDQVRRWRAETDAFNRAHAEAWKHVLTLRQRARQLDSGKRVSAPGVRADAALGDQLARPVSVENLELPLSEFDLVSATGRAELEYALARTEAETIGATAVIRSHLGHRLPFGFIQRLSVSTRWFLKIVYGTAAISLAAFVFSSSHPDDEGALAVLIVSTFFLLPSGVLSLLFFTSNRVANKRFARKIAGGWLIVDVDPLPAEIAVSVVHYRPYVGDQSLLERRLVAQQRFSPEESYRAESLISRWSSQLNPRSG